MKDNLSQGMKENEDEEEEEEEEENKEIEER